jgi:hypothetical protein|tara:strand:+ start:554 stop:760 length:207 start_codon:yes stop_codon:yes gene_type:complete
MSKLYNEIEMDFILGKGSIGGVGKKTRTKKKHQSNTGGKYTSKHARISQAKIEIANKKSYECKNQPKV